MNGENDVIAGKNERCHAWVRLSRRGLLRRGAVIGLSGTTLSALLAACGGAVAPPTSTTVAQATTATANAPAMASTSTANATASAVSTPPILFVHGNGDSSALWMTTLWRFESAGYPRERLLAIDYPYPSARDDDTIPQPSRSGTDEQREQLAAFVGQLLAKTGGDTLALVGNSRGGYAIRNHLKHGSGAAQTSHAVLCGTPNHGVYAIPGNNSEFNGAGAFLQDLNSESEVMPGVALMTIRSDKNDKFAQPTLAGGQPSGIGYDGPELQGARNIVLPGVDHRETAYSPRAFAETYTFITGRPLATTAIQPEPAPRLSGLVTGYENTVPTNKGVAGVEVTVYEVDSATGARRGDPVHRATTGVDGAWGIFTATPTACCEFLVQAPGQPPRHWFRSPFPRSTTSLHLRLFVDAPPPPGQAVIIFTRPRGYVATGRDQHLLDGKPVPGVKAGVPTDASFRVAFDGPERGVPVALNGETLTARAIPGALVYAEFHY